MANKWQHKVSVIRPDDMEYGKIYILTDLYTPEELVRDYKTAMAKACSQPEALKRFDVEVVYTDSPPMVMARRFNAGNIGKTAILSCQVCGDINIDGHLVAEFVKRLFDFSQLDSGDDNVNISDFMSSSQLLMMQDALENPDLLKKLDNAKELATSPEVKFEGDDLQDAEGKELAEAEQQREMYLELIGKLVVNYVSLEHKNPHVLLGEMLSTSSSLLTTTTPLVFTSKKLSPLVIGPDLKLRLTDFNNAEVRLHPLSKALYILFLKHPEGIELRNIDNYRDELQDIYEIIMPGRDDSTTEMVMENVLNPLSGTLVQNLSRIKRFFKTIIMDDEIARNYYIHGKRGETYGISLPRNLVTLPRVFSL